MAGTLAAVRAGRQAPAMAVATAIAIAIATGSQGMANGSITCPTLACSGRA